MTVVPREINLDRLQRQEHAEFEQLVKTYHAPLITVARAIIGDSLAEEVVQEAWVSIFNGLPSFESRSSLKTWLYTIVANQAKTRLRKEKRTVALEDLSPQGDADPWLSQAFDDTGHWRNPVTSWHLDTPEQLLEESHLQKCIDHTLSLLPIQQKAVFMLRDIEQESLANICNILKVSDSYVRVLLHRARLKLLQVINHYQETGEC